MDSCRVLQNSLYVPGGSFALQLNASFSFSSETCLRLKTMAFYLRLMTKAQTKAESPKVVATVEQLAPS